MNETMLSSNLFPNVSSAILPSALNALCAIANENMFGNTFAPKCSSGIRNCQRARLPPAIEGDADITKACLSLNGCGRKRETQSMEFLISPGMEPLYSGDEIMKASFANNRLRNSSAPGG